jgi:hypothetical protein
VENECTDSTCICTHCIYIRIIRIMNALLCDHSIRCQKAYCARVCLNLFVCICVYSCVVDTCHVHVNICTLYCIPSQAKDCIQSNLSYDESKSHQLFMFCIGSGTKKKKEKKHVPSLLYPQQGRGPSCRSSRARGT